VPELREEVFIVRLGDVSAQQILVFRRCIVCNVLVIIQRTVPDYVVGECIGRFVRTLSWTNSHSGG